ncbi:uncharacterized protein AC631_03632 [Debaryomyces fabryi]|uniref:LIM zinc-binding domain-containing protein n=1 Tax=Debaryomyces fabryi TaxID=58627 RepID=A0A0V1PWF1_9ASCO|nr:uncharacterized protein AC631_03632 [Debaryomyces fabryi]KSA00587.1 hypothetical protein AC631_03632 [Debaryomyces fabryi]CUM56180.1 unnamed protein product [Debaryomyces fabryi]
MEPKLQTLPQYFKTETSPMIQHSAFPPFKIEHRYRGVYERAGFDVNLKGDSPTSEMRSMKSPTMLRFPQSSNGVKSSNSSAHSVGGSMKNDYVVPGSAKTTKSFGELQKRTPYPVYENRAHSESEPNTSNLSPVSPDGKSPSSIRFHEVPQNARSVNPEIPVVQIQHCDTAENTELPPPSNNGFTFMPSSTQNKNLKNLSLNLNDSQSSKNDNSQVNENDDDSIETESYDTTSETSFNNHYNQINDVGSKRSSQSSIKTTELITSSLMQPGYGLPSPPPTSKSSELQTDDSLIKKQRLSSALNEFRKDIEDHKNYVPKTPSVPNTPTFGEAPQLPTSLPPNKAFGQIDVTQNSSRFSYNQNYVNSANDVSLTKNISLDQNIDPSNQFQDFRNQQLAADTQLNDEYQNFLQSGNKSQPRASQVSMVSSILSKDSDYEMDGGADEEMERQLHALKMGENYDDSTVNEAVSSDIQHQKADSNDNIDISSSWDTIPKRKSNVITAAIPTINIQNIDEDDSPVSANNSFENNDTQDCTWESIKPLSINNSEKEQSNGASHNGVIEKEINVDDSNDGIEVKPLSPKNHLVEEELRDMNFAVQEVPNSGQKNYNNEREIQDHSFKYPSGKGPCRVCQKEISPISKGPQKSVFSKTGELSGQWHRSCFTCAYAGCTVKFSKSIQCYVYDDNAFCHNHYHELNDTLCQYCSKGIEGECVENELYQKWHLHCLTCHQCKCQINKDYYLINGACYCEEDALKIIKGGSSYEDLSGNLKTGGLTTSDKVEKRRTRIMYVE